MVARHSNSIVHSAEEHGGSVGRLHAVCRWLAILASIRRESPSLPCVLMCRDLNKRLEKKLLALGANAVFEKPLLLPDAMAFIKDAMSTNARQDRAANDTA